MADQTERRVKAPRMKIETATTESREPTPKADERQQQAQASGQRAKAPRPRIGVSQTPAVTNNETAESFGEASWEAGAATRTSDAISQNREDGKAKSTDDVRTSQSAGPAQEVGQGKAATFSGAREAATGWVHRTFPGHENAFWGGVVALLVALCVFAIGIGRVLFMCALVVLGVAIGQMLDGDPKIIRTVRELFQTERDQR